MKNIKKYLLVMLVTVFAASSCTDFVDPAIPYSDFETGVYLRTLKSFTPINYFDLNNAKFEVTVEVVDEEGGKLLKDVDLFVKRRRGATVTPEVLVKNIPASAFGPIADRNFPPAPVRNFPGAVISATVNEALAKMNLTQADIDGGDFFEFRLELHDTKGRTFTNTNLSPDVSGGAFYASPFFYRVPVVCPSTLAGTYNLSTTGWCGDTYNGKVQFKDGANKGEYIILVDLDGTFTEDFSFGFYRACYGPTTAPPGAANGLLLTDACGKISFNSKTSSPWGDSFKVNDVTVNGSVLTLDIESSYPPEQGVATITRTDGTNWPPLKK